MRKKGSPMAFMRKKKKGFPNGLACCICKKDGWPGRALDSFPRFGCFLLLLALLYFAWVKVFPSTVFFYLFSFFLGLCLGPAPHAGARLARDQEADPGGFAPFCLSRWSFVLLRLLFFRNGPFFFILFGSRRRATHRVGKKRRELRGTQIRERKECILK
nr:hypothetical protein [Pandoravirus massiliensis]